MELVNVDPFILIALSYVHGNPLIFGALWGVLKIAAKRSKNTDDDKILTMIGNLFGVKF